MFRHLFHWHISSILRAELVILYSESDMVPPLNAERGDINENPGAFKKKNRNGQCGYFWVFFYHVDVNNRICRSNPQHPERRKQSTPRQVVPCLLTIMVMYWDHSMNTVPVSFYYAWWCVAGVLFVLLDRVWMCQGKAVPTTLTHT